MQISIIAAMAHHRIIGYQGQMPWHLPSELAYFKKITLGKPIIMGRKTFDSIGKPLPQRQNIILSRQAELSLEGCEVCADLETALTTTKGAAEVMIIGGASLYEQALPLATKLYLTIIDADTPGDTYFPEWKPQQWHTISQQQYTANEYNPYDYKTVVLERIAGT